MKPHQFKPLIDKAIRESGLRMLKTMLSNKEMFAESLKSACK